MGKLKIERTEKVYRIEIEISGDAFYRYGGALTPAESEAIEVERILDELVKEIRTQHRLDAYRNLVDFNGNKCGKAEVEGLE